MGLIKLPVSEVTMPENAPPMSTPTAISITLPRRANALNCEMKFFMMFHPFVCLLHALGYHKGGRQGQRPGREKQNSRKTAVFA